MHSHRYVRKALKKLKNYFVSYGPIVLEEYVSVNIPNGIFTLTKSSQTFGPYGTKDFLTKKILTLASIGT